MSGRRIETSLYRPDAEERACFRPLMSGRRIETKAAPLILFSGFRFPPAHERAAD